MRHVTEPHHHAATDDEACVKNKNSPDRKEATSDTTTATTTTITNQASTTTTGVTSGMRRVPRRGKRDAALTAAGGTSSSSSSSSWTEGSNRSVRLRPIRYFLICLCFLTSLPTLKATNLFEHLINSFQRLSGGSHRDDDDLLEEAVFPRSGGRGSGAEATLPPHLRRTALFRKTLHEHYSYRWTLLYGGEQDFLTSEGDEEEEEENEVRGLVGLTAALQGGLQRNATTEGDYEDQMEETRILMERTYQTYLYPFGDVLKSTAESPREQKRRIDHASLVFGDLLENSLGQAFPPFPKSLRDSNLKILRNMFQKGYDAYMYNGWPAGEVGPLSCRPKEFDLVKIPGLTLIDALDTLCILGNFTEFARAVERLRGLHRENVDGGLFSLDQNVSVFETNIRVLGGLLSAHQMAEAWLEEEAMVLRTDVFRGDGVTVRSGRDPVDVATCAADWDSDPDPAATLSACTDPQTCVAVSASNVQRSEAWRKNATLRAILSQADLLWSYDGFLLDLAVNIGGRLIRAFETETGIPYGTVHLQNGIPPQETKIASTAGGGTLSLEFTLLSKLTGDPTYGEASKRAARSLWTRQSSLNLVGKHINIQTGVWTESLSGIGSNSDSFTEYLFKQYLLFPEDNDFWILFIGMYAGVFSQLRRGDWYADADMATGARAKGKRVLESLMAFFPGLQILAGELAPAVRSLNAFYQVREYLGFLPERFQYESWRVDSGGAGKHPLRPELLESGYFAHRAHPKEIADSSGWLWAADFALAKLAEITPASCGFASLDEVREQSTGRIDNSEPLRKIRRMDEMPSFFLTETIKYLYLTFDDDNTLHEDDSREWIFTTEAHPIHNPEKNPELLSDGVEILFGLLSDRLGINEDGHPHTGRSEYRARMAHQNFVMWGRDKEVRDYASMLGEFEARSILNEGEDGPSPLPLDRVLPVSDTQRGTRLVRSRDAAYPGALWYDVQPHANIAHLAYTPRGGEEAWRLQKSCFNVWSSEWLWLRALHGGGGDYVPEFWSLSSDELLYQRDSQLILMGATDALGRHGTGLHPSEVAPSCFVGGEKSKKVQTTQEPSAESSDKSGKLKAPATAEVSTDFGDFQISAFEQGSGFEVIHADSGQMLMTTFVTEAMDWDPAFVMTLASYPRSQSSQSPANLEQSISSSEIRWVLHRHELEMRLNGNQPSADRFVIMSDFHGNSFTCDVELVILETEDNNELDTLFRIPCTPALFGPTHMNEMIKLGEDTIIDATLFDPNEEDLFGCDDQSRDYNLFWEEVNWRPEDTEVENVCDSAIIQVVHRGECSFIDKAVNQKLGRHAKGVIVINDDQDEVFIMSYGIPDIEDVKNPNLPVSVMVSGDDGFRLLESAQLIADNLSSDKYVIARIALRRQERASNKDSSLRFPVVEAEPSVLKVLSRNGWGIQALEQKDSAETSWHLHLIRHNLDSSTATATGPKKPNWWNKQKIIPKPQH